MAITVLRTPSDLAPIKNPVEFGFQASNSGAGVYTATVFLGVNSQDVCELNFTCDSERKFYFRLDQILLSLAPIRALNGIGIGDGEYWDVTHLILYTVKVKLYKDGILVDGVGIDGQAYQEDFYAVRAGLDYMMFIQKTWETSLLGERYASILPQKRTITRDEYFCVSWYNPHDFGTYISWKLYDVNGDIIPGERVTGGGNANTISSILASWNSLATNLSWLGLSKDDVYSFEFELYYTNESSEAVLIEQTLSPRYYLKPKTTTYPLRSFVFLNSLGGYDVMTVTGRKASMLEVTKETAELYYPANYLVSQPQSVDYNIKRQEKQTIDTGFIKTNDDRYRWQDFIASEDIYEMVQTPEGWDAALPIRITTTKAAMGADKQYNGSLEIEYVYRFENFGFTKLLKPS